MDTEQHANISGNVEKSIFTSGNRNMIVLGNILIYPSTCEQTPQQPVSATEIGPNPYKGLFAFQEQDRDRFFGRTELINTLYQAFVALHSAAPGKPNPTRLLAVLGPSGSGKSSVVRAGLLPRLACHPLHGLRQTRAAILTPEDHPLEKLAISLARMAFDDAVPVAKADEFANAMRKANHKGEWDGLRRIAAAMPWIEGAAIMLLIDQFEEVYTMCQDGAERRCFIDNLLHAAADRAAHVSVVLTLRSDFLEHTQSHPHLNQLIAANAAIVHVMTESELREAIARPAELAGQPLDDATIALLIQQSKEREGALPLLQFALTQIWDSMGQGQPPTETLKRIGGVGGALANKAEEVYKNLDEQGRAIARRAFLAMVRLGEGTRDTRRRVSLAEIVAHGEAREQVHEVLQNFSQFEARLITLSTDEHTRETISEITHEALFEHWETLKQWLEHGRDDLRFHRRLAEAARHWKTNERAEGLLWRSPDLELLQDYHRRAGSEMTTLQREFFQASVKRQQAEEAAKEAQYRKELETQQKLTAEARARQEAETRARQEAEHRVSEQTRASRNLRWLVRGMVVLLLAAVAVALFAWYQQIDSQEQSYRAEEAGQIAEQRRLDAEKARRKAERQTRIATARQLAAQSQAVQKEYPQRSLLLAIEAVRMTDRKPYVAEAEQALRDALSSTGGQGLGGHEAPIKAVAVSPDGRWLATGSEDGTAQLWDLQADDIAAAATVLRGHEDGVRAVALSMDGRWLMTGSEDGTARLWDLQAKDIAASATVLRGHEDAVTAVALSVDGRWLATGSEDGTARLWDLQAKDIAASATVLRGHEDAVTAVALSVDGRWLATGSGDGTVRLWNLQADDIAASATVLRGHESGARVIVIIRGVTAVALSADGRWLATGSEDGTARLWNLQVDDIAASARVLRGHEGGVGAVALSVDGRWLMTGSEDGTARLWDLQVDDIAASARVLRGHEGGVGAVALSVDGRWLATGSEDGTARLWDLQAEDIAASAVVLRGHESFVAAVALSADRRWLATGNVDHTVRLWDLQAEDIAASARVLRGHKGPVWAVALSADGRWLATGSGDGTVRLWDLQAEDIAASATVLRGHESTVTAVSLSVDGRWLATGSRDGTARLWDLQAEDIAASALVLHGHKGPVWAVLISVDGRWLATGSGDATARLWDLQATDIAASALVLRGHNSPIHDVAISADGRWLVTSDSDYSARLWDLQADDIAASALVLRGHEHGIEAIAISTDGRWLVTDSRDATARLWDLQATDIAASALVLRGHGNVVRAVAISADGRWLVTGSDDKTARLWDLQADDIAASTTVLRGHEDVVGAVAISVDGRWLATGSEDATVRLWDLQAEDLFARACRTVGRNLSYTEWEQYFRDQPYHRSCPEFPGHYTVINVLLERGEVVAKQGNIEEAVALFQQVQALDPENPKVDFNPVDKATEEALTGLAREGKIQEALAAYAEAQQLYESLKISAQSWFILCRFGIGWNQAEIVLDACEQAVTLEPEDGFYKAFRGIAYAMTDRTKEAIQDLQAYSKWAGGNERDRNLVQGWIESLENGENPFTDEVLESLR